MTIAGTVAAGYSGDGAAASLALLNNPTAVAVAASGRVFIADSSDEAIRLLTPPPSNCTYSIFPASFQSPAGGGSVSLAIETAPGCPWAPSDLPSWISISGSSSGAGPASLEFALAANFGPIRSAQIGLAGVLVTFDQASDAPTISPAGVVNAASYSTTVAPGSIIAIFGDFPVSAPAFASAFPIPTTLGGLSLPVGSLGNLLFPAPIFSAGRS